MMCKIAHMRENRKANKGFSLVELIIVMAIMVALVAVLAPQYMRYLKRSRDAVVKNAGEDVLTAVKTDMIDPQGHLSGTGTITVQAGENGATITVTPANTIVYTANNGVDTAPETDATAYITRIAGISGKQVKSAVVVTITIGTAADGSYTFNSDGGEPTNAGGNQGGNQGG